jgi:GntR family transcriptional regulator
MANAEPMAIQTAHIPLALAPGVVGETFENSSLYDLLQGRYGLQPLRARETNHAVAGELAVAELLEILPGSAVFVVEQTTFLPSGKALEFVQSAMRGDRYSIILEPAANRTPQAVREPETIASTGAFRESGRLSG